MKFFMRFPRELLSVLDRAGHLMLPTVEQPRSQHYGAPGPPSFAFLVIVERACNGRSFPLPRCNLNERLPRRHLPVTSASAAARFPKPNGETQRPFGNAVDSETTGADLCSGRSVEVSPRYFLKMG